MGGGGGMFGSIIQSGSAALQAVVGQNAIGKAGQAINNGYNDAYNQENASYAETQGYLRPWADAGKDGLVQLQDFLKNYKEFDGSQLKDDEGYKFRLSEGLKALDRSAASKGQVLSGRQLQAVAGYNQGLASQEYQNAFGRYLAQNQNRFNQLSYLPTMGANMAGQQARYSDAHGSRLSDLILGRANARASETMGQYRNWQEQDTRAADAWSGFFKSEG